MKIDPYLHFNGTCADAIALYEKAFNVKASHVMKYGDAPPEEGHQIPPGTENFIMHATLPIGDNGVMLCDVPPDYAMQTSTAVSLHIALDSKESAQAAFDILKEGGEVGMELQKTFWSEYFGSLTDKFGISWMISI